VQRTLERGEGQYQQIQSSSPASYKDGTELTRYSLCCKYQRVLRKLSISAITNEEKNSGLVGAVGDRERGPRLFREVLKQTVLVAILNAN